MPTRSKKPCAKPGCPNLAKTGQTYCSEHREDKKKLKRQRDKEYNKKRDLKLRKFYSSGRWRKVRNRYIRKHPLCEYCKEKDEVTPATEVDHVIPVKVRWDLRLDPENLKSSCHSCHMKKTKEDKKKYSKC